MQRRVRLGLRDAAAVEDEAAQQPGGIPAGPGALLRLGKTWQLRSTVGVDGDAGARARRFDQLETERGSVVEQLLSGARDQGIHQEYELVDEVVAQQRLDQRAAAPDADLVVLLLQLGRLFDKIAPQQGRVVPRDLAQGA